MVRQSDDGRGGHYERCQEREARVRGRPAELLQLAIETALGSPGRPHAHIVRQTPRDPKFADHTPILRSVRGDPNFGRKKSPREPPRGRATGAAGGPQEIQNDCHMEWRELGGSRVHGNARMGSKRIASWQKRGKNSGAASPLPANCASETDFFSRGDWI
jgi:hypothetical protein